MALAAPRPQLVEHKGRKMFWQRLFTKLVSVQGPNFLFPFCFSLAFVLWLSSCHQKFKMTKFSLKLHHLFLNPHFEWKQLSFDDFLLTTWEQDVEIQQNRALENPGLHYSLIIKSPVFLQIQLNILTLLLNPVISLFGEELATNMNSCSNYVGNVSEKNGTIKPKWPKAHWEKNTLQMFTGNYQHWSSFSVLIIGSCSI